MAADRDQILQRLRSLSHLLDNSFRIPVIGYRVGWDAIIGLIPGFGDAVMLLPAGYIIYEAYRLGAPKAALARMVANVGLETLVGAVPLLGDIFDATYKANTRNLYLLEKHVGPIGAAPVARPSNRGLAFFLIGTLIVVGGGVALLVWLFVWVFRQLF